MTLEQNINTVEHKNGAAQKGSEPVVDASSKDRAAMEKNLEDLRKRIIDLSKRHDKAFTTEEKNFIVNRLKLLEFNYKVLRNKYDAKYDLLDLKDIAINTPNDEPYNVDDPQIRKKIGYSLSYSCGKHEYTEREVIELKKLIPDIDEPVIIK